MPDYELKEEPLQFGVGGRLFGILTRSRIQSSNWREFPVFIFLNAGMLHRVGPYGLYVRLARDLALMGFSSLRIDLAGKGDSPIQTGLTHSQSLAADFREIKDVLELKLGASRLVLAGLCSGADDAVRCASTDERVIGMLLLDPVCFPDDGFRARATIMKYTNRSLYISWLKRRLNLLAIFQNMKDQENEISNSLTIRDSPTRAQLHNAIDSITRRGGRVMSVFTEYAIPYYNKLGQLGRNLNIAGYENSCTEIFWPQVMHTFSLELHRRKLIEECKIWATGFGHTQIRNAKETVYLRKSYLGGGVFDRLVGQLRRST